MFERGDIVVNYRKKYKGPFKYLLTRLICFFTTAYWKDEATSKVYHAEMVYTPSDTLNEVKDISQEWPCVKITDFGKLSRKAVFRLKNKPVDFEAKFEEYCTKTIGQPYDWPKILMMAFFWLFRGTGLARLFVNLAGSRKRDICSEYVAKFYKYETGVMCANVEPGYTAPDDILDYCHDHPELFDIIIDNEGDV